MSDQAGPGVPPQPSSPDEKDKAPNRVVLSDSELGNLSTSEFQSHWRQQDTYITSLEQRLSLQEGELAELRQAAERSRCQLTESQQREKVLVRRLAAKEQETQDYVVSTTLCETTHRSGSNVQMFAQQKVFLSATRV